jgi:hypothetical protein
MFPGKLLVAEDTMEEDATSKDSVAHPKVKKGKIHLVCVSESLSPVFWKLTHTQRVDRVQYELSLSVSAVSE